MSNHQDFSSIPMTLVNVGQTRISGVIKERCEDFDVEEIPAYQPCGQGEHLYLWIEKKDISSERLREHLLKSLKIPEVALGMAGMKDRHGVTRQYVSVPVSCVTDIKSLDTDNIHILHSIPHTNKLRTGHLKGNKFRIQVRQIEGIEQETNLPLSPEKIAAEVKSLGQEIRARGFKNYYGLQRFGKDRDNAQQGLELIRGQIKPSSLPRPKRRFLTRLWLSAIQSWLFNEYVSQRDTDGLLSTVLQGDVMQRTQASGLFVALDTVAEQARLDAGETVVTGPMFGSKMKQPEGDSLHRETSFLAKHNIALSDFTPWSQEAAGTRRPIIARADDLQITPNDDGLLLEFSLEAGCYATILIDHLLVCRNSA